MRTTRRCTRGRAAATALAALTGLAAAVATAGTAAAAPAPGAPGGATSTVVFSAGFDDGTTDGFAGDPATVAVAPARAGRTGPGALYTSRLRGYGEGAAVTLPKGLPDGYYAATAWTRLPLWTDALPGPQDLRIAVPGSPSVQLIQTGVGRTTSAGYRQLVTYLRISSATSAAPVRLRVEPVAACPDAPKVPGPFLLDDVTLGYLGTVPPPLPYLPPPTCPLHPTATPTPTPTA